MRRRLSQPVRELPRLPCAHLQGLPKDEKQNEGRVPRPIDVELAEDLVESCLPGDMVTVLGIVKVISGEAAGGEHVLVFPVLRNGKTVWLCIHDCWPGQCEDEDGCWLIASTSIWAPAFALGLMPEAMSAGLYRVIEPYRECMMPTSILFCASKSAQ